MNDMKEDFADIMGIPVECIQDIQTAHVPEGSLLAFDHPAAAPFTPEMLDEFMDRLRKRPGFGNVGLTDKSNELNSVTDDENDEEDKKCDDKINDNHEKTVKIISQINSDDKITIGYKDTTENDEFVVNNKIGRAHV